MRALAKDRHKKKCVFLIILAPSHTGVERRAKFVVVAGAITSRSAETIEPKQVLVVDSKQ